MTIRARYDAAVAALAAEGITTVFDTKNCCSSDAWCDAADEHDKNRLAVIFESGAEWRSDGLYVRDDFRDRDWVRLSTLPVSYPYWDTSVADAIVAAFKAEGFDVEWDGEPERRGIVHLGS